MDKRIIFSNANGVAAVIIPTKETKKTIEEIAAQRVPANVEFKIVDKAVVPSDRSYRGAWIVSNEAIEHDMVKARDIHREKLRILRKPLLEELDIAYQRADEENNNQLKAEIAQKKRRLRDITTLPEIETAQTIEQLKLIGMDLFNT